MSYPPPVAPPARGFWGWFKGRKPITQVLLPIGLGLALCCGVPASCTAMLPPAKDDAGITRTGDEAAAAASASAKLDTVVLTSPSPSLSPSPSPTPSPAPTCHPNYSVCLPVTTDVDCGETSHKNFQVLGGTDPYRLDADNDGIACESSTTSTTKPPAPSSPKPPPPPPPANNCHPNYSVCLPKVADLDCGEISQRNFRVIGGSDPYRLDGNKDGIACES